MHRKAVGRAPGMPTLRVLLALAASTVGTACLGGSDSPQTPAASDGRSVSEASCCAAVDYCAWANDGVCDCEGEFDWDASDCGGVLPGGGVEPAGVEVCCAEEDPCGWAGDGACDCGGAFEWDGFDCAGAGEGCCADEDPCGWADDGACDCGGSYPWDAADCGATQPGGTDATQCNGDEDCSEYADCVPGCSPGTGQCIEPRLCITVSIPGAPPPAPRPFCACDGTTIQVSCGGVPQQPVAHPGGC